MYFQSSDDNYDKFVWFICIDTKFGKEHQSAQAYGNDKIASIELVYGSKPKNESFLLSNTTWSDDKRKQRVMMLCLEV
jgi:hypothetical protein